VADIVTAIEEATPVTEGAQGDMTHALCEQLHHAMLEHMKTISLRGLALEQKAKGFQVQARKPGKKALLKQAAPTLSRPNAPNSVFALGSWLPTRA
jgi:Rrf2 family iron-sulfur cluster assembly transcriptional regulator